MTLVWLIVTISLITIWPYLLFKRMKKVRSEVTARARERQEGELQSPERMLETIKSADGFVYQRSHQFHEALSEADKEAKEQPDIGKTLAGLR